MITEEIFSSPCKHPNGLQWTEKGLYVMDQELDDVYNEFLIVADKKKEVTDTDFPEILQNKNISYG